MAPPGNGVEQMLRREIAGMLLRGDLRDPRIQPIAAISGGSGWTGAAIGGVVGGTVGNIKGKQQQQRGY